MNSCKPHYSREYKAVPGMLKAHVSICFCYHCYYYCPITADTLDRGHWAQHLQFSFLLPPALPRRLMSEKWLQLRYLPEGDGVGVSTFPLPDQEGPGPRGPHQHVLKTSPSAQPMLVPPAAQAQGNGQGRPLRLAAEEEGGGSLGGLKYSPGAHHEITQQASPPKIPSRDGNFENNHPDTARVKHLCRGVCLEHERINRLNLQPLPEPLTQSIRA